MSWGSSGCLSVFLFFSFGVFAEPLQVTTFNIGGAQVRILNKNLDTVKCRKSRLPAQIEEIPKFVNPPFVLLLQEVLGDAEMMYRKMAQDHHYSVTTPSTQGNGVMILSSERILESSFTPFQSDTYISRGVLRAVIE